MNTKTSFVILCLIILLGACSENQKSNPENSEIPEIKVDRKSALTINLSDIAESIRYGQLEIVSPKTQIMILTFSD